MDTLASLIIPGIMAVCLIGTLYIIIPAVIKVILYRWFVRRVGSSSTAFLTFDDGPSPETTLQILNLLDNAGVKATFFVLGERAARHPELIDQIRQRGHEIGSHSYWHTHAWKTGPMATLADLVKGMNVLKKPSPGADVSCFRPPYGKLNLASLVFLVWAKTTPVFWTLDPKDHDQPTGNSIFEYVRDHLAPGQVVLLHDGIGAVEDGMRVTVAALGPILADARARGVPFGVMSDIMRS
jgi:peptidoglycan-N-acetylglucosamine deacetylase